MNLLYFLLAIGISWNILFTSIYDNQIEENQTKNQYNRIDSIWMQFAKAMDSKNIDFLIANSLDTITCTDCKIEPDFQREDFDSKFIFQNHLREIMHLKTLSNKEFSTFLVGDNLIRVVYNIRGSLAQEESYSLIFTLINENGKYLFQGMLVQ